MHEWVAHPSAVTCVSLGKRSFELVATGGEDQRVNVWRLRSGDSSAANVVSLPGHSSPLSCVSFDENESQLVSGSVGGVVRLYDLGEGRCARTIQAHRTLVNDLHPHPFGDFVATGGGDAHVKVWDVRRKACIQSHKVEAGQVNAVRFSPDGRWVASCDDATGFVRFWDLTAGKLLEEMPVSRERPAHGTHLEFSPCEFVLACAASDRVARLFDVDRFELIAATPAAPSTISGLSFSPAGNSIVAATDAGARQLSNWDSPALRLAIYENLAWDQLKCIAVRGGGDGETVGTCLGLSSAASFVSLWRCDVEDDRSEKADRDEAERKSGSSQAKIQQQLQVVRINAAKHSPRSEPKEFHQRIPPKCSTAPVFAESKVKSRDEDDDDTTDAAEKLDDTASLLTEVLLGRSSSRVLEERLDALKEASSLWANGEARGALKVVKGSCVSCRNNNENVVERWTLASDFLGAIDSDSLSLDVALEVVDIVKDLVTDFATKIDEDVKLASRHMKLALGITRELAELYGGVIRGALANYRPNGVDLAAEDRRSKCEAARASFAGIAKELPAVRTTFQADRHVDDLAQSLAAVLRDYRLQ